LATVPLPKDLRGGPETILTLATEVPLLPLASPTPPAESSLGVRIFQAQGQTQQVVLVRIAFSSAAKAGALERTPADLRRAMIADFMATWGEGFSVLDYDRITLDGREGERGVLTATGDRTPIGEIFATTDLEGVTLVSIISTRGEAESTFKTLRWTKAR
jgi:hypothetical protein